jgi:hypothetical protein
MFSTVASVAVVPKNVGHKEVLSWANFRSRLPEHVRSLEQVVQRSTVALAVVYEIADRKCARSRDEPIRLPIKSASTKRLFVCATCCKFEKIPWNDVLSIFHIHWRMQVAGPGSSHKINVCCSFVLHKTFQCDVLNARKGGARCRNGGHLHR